MDESVCIVSPPLKRRRCKVPVPIDLSSSDESDAGRAPLKKLGRKRKKAQGSESDGDFVPSPPKKAKRKPAVKKVKGAPGDAASDEVPAPKKTRRKPAVKKEDGGVPKKAGKRKPAVKKVQGEPSALGTTPAEEATRKRISPVEEVSKSVVKKVEVNNELPLIKDENEDGEDLYEEQEMCCDVSVLETSRLWQTEELVAELACVEYGVAKKVIQLLDQECTIPFIARYRREVTGGLEPDKLRDIQSSYGNVRNLMKRADSVAKILAREKKLEGHLVMALSNAKSLAEIEHLYAPYKSGSKRSLAEKARQLGLEEGAQKILNGTHTLHSLGAGMLVCPDVKGLASEHEVLLGWQHIAADVVAKNTDVLDFVRRLCRDKSVTLIGKKSSASKKDSDTCTTSSKFEHYFDFRHSVATIKPHQVLALNRGESQKALTVKIEIPESIKRQTVDFCTRKWSTLGDRETHAFLCRTAEDAYARLLEPLICRQIRAELTKVAEKASVKVFCENLKCLLLTPPVRGRVVAGIDPGFIHGCKVAVVSSAGEVLSTGVLYIHSKKGNKTFASQQLRKILQEYSCETIALGNGTACRETETFLSDLISSDFFHPLSPQYCIVNENGISIYSVTKEAEAELPSLEPNLRSAVSLARRLQDPLLEYVKVEPKHVGVGMYQHDIAEATLKSALDEVTTECVSFVGIDLNVSSEVVLRRISGLNATRARGIVTWREANGPFRNRRQLLLVKGLGAKTFEQCAGFVKILPQTSRGSTAAVAAIPVATTKGGKKKKVEIRDTPNPLDMTVIHPESYDVAQRFLSHVNAKLEEVGEASTIQRVKSCTNADSLENLSVQLGCSLGNLQLIVEALQQPIEYDLRAEFEKPLFKKCVMSLEELEVGQVLTGRVTNNTQFGAFVDVGVGCDGLIHASRLGGRRVALGDRVTVRVLTLDKDKKRVGLQLDRDDTASTPFKRERVAIPSKPAVPDWEKIHQVVNGEVTSVVDYGVFVEVGCSRPGLLHVSRIRGDPKKWMRGDKLRVRIANVTQDNKISLQMEDDDSDVLHSNKIAEGVLVRGRVSNLKEYGAFVDLGGGVHGLIHRSQLKGMQVCRGDKVSCKVLRLPPGKGPQLELMELG